MKKILMLSVILLAAAVVFQGTAFAGLVHGTVASIDSAAKSVSVNRTNPATGATEKVDIAIGAETTFSGVASMDELKAGDDIWVDAQQDAATGGWKAASVKVSGANAPAAAQ